MSQQHPPHTPVLSSQLSFTETQLGGTSACPAGRIMFVGSGTGLPGLLTAAGLQAIREAELVITSDEVNRRLLRDQAISLRADASLVELSEQSELSEVVADAVRAGRSLIARMVLGDPLQDAQIAAEVTIARTAGLRVDVLPGVSWMSATSSLAGLHLVDAGPVTQVSYHAGAGLPAAQPGSLLVSATSDELAALVQDARQVGHSGDEQVLFTHHCGDVYQHTQATTLGRLAQLGQQNCPQPAPVMVVFGEATNRDPALDWFEAKPLIGWNVLVPRTRKPSSAMLRQLELNGAQYFEVATMEVEPPRNPAPMEKAIHGLVDGRFGWIIFTSENAVRAILDKLVGFGLDARAFSGLRIAAVNDHTAAALAHWGIRADLIPSGQHTCAGLVAEFPACDDLLDPINRVLLPRADIATELLSDGLAELGWEVEDVTAYRTVRAAPPPAETREAIKTGRFDAVLFTSSSTVRNLVGVAGKPHSATVIAAIGSATADTCREHGLRVDVVADQPDPLALVDALACFADERAAGLRAAGQPVVRPSARRRRRTKSGV